MPLIETIRFDDAHDFIACLRRSGPMWNGKLDSDTGWIFRGQGDANWSLLPRALRGNTSNSLLVSYRSYLARQRAQTDWATWLSERMATLPQCSPAILADVALDALVHILVVRQFAILADDVRHRVTINPMLTHAGDERRREFAHYFVGDIDADAAEMFAVAQHHGVPTRFLDWTNNPVVAAYFAAAGSYSPGSDREIAVWALRKDVFDFQWNLQRLTVRAGVTPFLDAQEGLFTWDVTAYFYKATVGAYRPLDVLLDEFVLIDGAQTVPRPLLRKLTMPISQVPKLLKLLWRERATPAHMMPTFDNVTQAMLIQAQWLNE